MFNYVADVHGFRADGMSDQDIWNVVAYVREVQAATDGGNLQGVPPTVPVGPGAVTFDVSCSECHNTPDAVGGVINPSPSVGEAPSAWNKIGP